MHHRDLDRSWIRRVRLAVLLVLCLCAGTATADEGPPLDVRVVADDPNTIPAPGDVVRATVEFESQVDLLLTDIGVDSGRNDLGQFDWETQSFGVPTDLMLEADVPQSFALELIANEPIEPFDVSYRVGNRTESLRIFAIEPSDHVAQSLPSGIQVIGAPVADVSPAVGADPEIDLRITPDPFPNESGAVLADKAAHADADDDEELSRASFLVRVQGQLVLQRPSPASDFVPADGTTVYVYDADSGDDDFLGSGVTKADGTFDFLVPRGNESGPDLYLLFIAGNGVMDVKYSGVGGFIGGVETTWRFTTGVAWNVTGDDYNFGTTSPPPPTFIDLNAAFYMGSILTKAWRYCSGLNYSSALERVRITWPNDVDTPFYRSSSKTIFMNVDRQWREDTIIHEFGHHWMHAYSASPSPDYCNPGGYQDQDGDCGHNQWCSENENVAWTEGFPNFLANVAIDWIQANYHSTLNNRNVEFIMGCGQAGGALTDPYKTESTLAAFLRDLADASNEVDTGVPGVGIDKITQGTASVMATASSAITPYSSTSFVNTHFALHSYLGSDYWFTGMNSGFDLDGAPPSWPGVLTSPSHPQYSTSDDATVDLTWDGATDDMSGVRRYYVRIDTTPSYPYPGDSFTVNGTSATTPELAPGTYYAMVLAEDWSGKQSVNYSTHGPFTINPPGPPDFAVTAGRGWELELVPRRTGDATTSSVSLPGFISGDQAETYFNYRVENTGNLPSAELVTNHLRVDGELTVINTIPSTVPLGGGQARGFINQGPYTVRGGRHTVGVLVDALGVMPEVDELDNKTVRQFVWAPSVIVNDPVTRSAPPDPYAGLSNPTVFTAPNCDGLSYSGYLAPFEGMAVIPLSDGDDTDIRSHPHTTGPQNGFGIFDMLASSSRGRSSTDIVVTNTTLESALVYDVGIRATDMQGDYRAEPLRSTEISSGTPTVVPFEAGQFASLHHFSLSPSFGTDHATLRVELDPPANGPLWVAIVDPDVAHLGLDGVDLVGQTMRGGVATIDWTYTEPLHGLILYRDPPSDGRGVLAMDVTVTVEPTPANFLPAFGLAGWVAPVAPTDGAPGSSSSVPAPFVLDGSAATTYVNVAIANDSPNPGVPLEFVTRVDDGSGPGAQTSGIVGGGTLTRNFSTPITVRGGRHTLWAEYDLNGLVAESDETDNMWGGQWVWSPTSLSPGPAVDFLAPPDPIAGVDAVALAQGPSFYLNCVGLRDVIPEPQGQDGHWQAVAVMPGANSDVDVRLHDVVPGTTNGFRDIRTASNWGTGRGDYVMTNFRVVSPQPMDVGVVSVQGAEDFMAQAVRSVFLDSQPAGVYGPFVQESRELLDLHEIELQAGGWAIDLVPLDAEADWGMTLHRANRPYHSKALNGDAPTAWEAPAGLNESMFVTVPEDGLYCLAVWKSEAADALQSARYRLSFGMQGTDAPPSGAVAGSRLRSVQPNPFNPRTVVHFEIERDAPVALTVFDVRGARVRKLIDGARTAGRHQAVWDGVDDAGRRVASGVYFVELRAAGVRDVTKAVLLK